MKCFRRVVKDIFKQKSVPFRAFGGAFAVLNDSIFDHGLEPASFFALIRKK